MRRGDRHESAIESIRAMIASKGSGVDCTSGAFFFRLTPKGSAHAEPYGAPAWVWRTKGLLPCQAIPSEQPQIVKQTLVCIIIFA